MVLELRISRHGDQLRFQHPHRRAGGRGPPRRATPPDERAAPPPEPRQLAVDNRMVVPVGAVVKVITTSSDVIHSFGVPAFWIKMDAVPGRLNETWFRAAR